METNEQGLTKEEKVMFSILGIILIVAIGVLIINSFSSNERKLEDNNTPITEGQTNNIKDETTTKGQEDSLIEDTPVENIVTNTASSNKTSTITKVTVNKVTNEEKPTTNGNSVPGLIEWSFKDTMITEAFSGETIEVDKNVILYNGKEVEAVVTVRKLEGNSWNIVELTNDEFQATEGTYKYYYTYSNQTKELLLVVKNKLSYEDINLLTLTSTYDETFTITEEEYNSYQTLLQNSSLTKENPNTLTIVKEENSLSIPLLLTLNEDLVDKTITSKTLGITTSTENNTWYQELTSKDLIIWIDLSIIDITNNEIIITIDNIDYYLYLDIVITEEEPSENEDQENTPEEEPSEDEEQSNENEEQPNENDEQEDTSTEEENENDSENIKPSEEPTEEENQTIEEDTQIIENINIIETENLNTSVETS